MSDKDKKQELQELLHKEINFDFRAVIFPVLLFAAIFGCISVVLFNSGVSFRKKQLYQFIHSPLLSDTECISLSNDLYGHHSGVSESLYTSDLLEMYHEDEAVDKVYGFDIEDALYNNESVLIHTGYPEAFDLIRCDLAEGSWFNGSSSDGYPDAVVCGDIFNNCEVGDLININPYSPGNHDESINQYGSITVRIIGKYQFPYDTFNFSQHISEEAYYLPYNTEPVIYLQHTTETVSLLNLSNFTVSPYDSFVYVKYKNKNSAEATKFRDKISSLRPTTADYSDHHLITPVSDLVKTQNSDFLPFFISNLLDPLNIFTLAVTVILVTLNTMFRYRKRSASLSQIIRTQLIITSVTSLLAWLQFFLYTHGRHCRTIPSPSTLGSILTSSYSLTILFYLLLFFLTVNLLSLIFPIRKIKQFNASKQLTQESYTRKEPEYFEEYEERDFEIANNEDK